MCKAWLVVVGVVLASCYYRGINVRSRSGTLSPATARIGVDPLAKRFVIDGLLDNSERRDPDCRRDCRSKSVPLRTMKARTGVDVGTITVSRDVARMRRVRDALDRDPHGRLIRTFNDLWAVRDRPGVYGSLLYTQQVPLIRGDPSAVREWFDAGLRMVQLAYSSRVPLAPLRRRNKLAGGADEPRQGLTDLGRRVVAELVARNVILDVSHCSEKTTMEILEQTDVPILCNHANAKALTVCVRGPMLLGRNKSDAELKAIAARGGVIGVTTVAWMLDRDGDTRADVDDFLAHVDYLVKLVGIDHVGVASDSRVDGWAPDDIHYADRVLASPGRWRVVAARLRREFGYSDEMLDKLLGGNFLRFYERVLPGVHPPRVRVDAKGVATFAPSVYRGVPEPGYVFEIEEWRDRGFRPFTKISGEGALEVNTRAFPKGLYRWRVVAESGSIRAASAWRETVVRDREVR